MTLPRPDVADLVAGLSIAGLLLPEAVAYSGLAGLPPQAGVIGLFAGLLAYGLLGSSRFAIVSATSSSAAVLFAATVSVAGGDVAARVALGTGLVLLAGLLFVGAGLARLGALASLIAKPVLRGFAFGLALTIVVKQLPAILVLPAGHGNIFALVWNLARDWQASNVGGALMGASAVVLLGTLSRWRRMPAALVVIVAGVALDAGGYCARWGIPSVGAMALDFSHPILPSLPSQEWLRMGELAFALMLILYAESYGSIRTFALRHGDEIDSNRDLIALGAANLLSALFQGVPVGAGYSATSANEAAGAHSRGAGLTAGAVMLVAVLALLPWIAHIPEPILAAIVVHAVAHTLSLVPMRTYFRWRRDRIVTIVAIAAVLVLGVLDGLLAAIAVSLLRLLQGFSRASVTWLGRLGDGHDYVDTERHTDALTPPRMLIARPEQPLFFGNVDAMFAVIRARVAGRTDLDRIVLSFEESPDLDATSIEALRDFAVFTRGRGLELILARVKDKVRDVLDLVNAPELPHACYNAWSVDDAVRRQAPASQVLP
jgi:SulP family sulfate permease